MAELATSGFPASATASCWFQRTNINAVVTVLRTRTCCQPSAKARLCACLECLKALVLAIASRLGRLLGAATARLRRVAHGGRHMQNRRPGEQPQRHQSQLAPVARGPGRTAPVDQDASRRRLLAPFTRGPGTNSQGQPLSQAWAAPETSPTHGACPSYNYRKRSTTAGTRAPTANGSSKT